MDSNTDLTLFWLAWQKTCSIRLCCTGHAKEYLDKCENNTELCSQISVVQKLAVDVITSMNKAFLSCLEKRQGIKGLRLSSFNDEAESWGDNNNLGSGFELIESHLYAREKLNGKAFKAYLFEDIANRPGGINKNIYGYLQRVLFTIINESFGENVYEPLRNEAGEEIEPKKISLNGFEALKDYYTPDECVEVKEIEVAFSAFLSEKNSVWDSDHWLVMFCILNLLRVGSAKVQPLFSKGHQTINVISSQLKRELLMFLRDKFSDKAIGMSLNGALQLILERRVVNMKWYAEIKNILEENKKSTGK